MLIEQFVLVKLIPHWLLTEKLLLVKYLPELCNVYINRFNVNETESTAAESVI